MPKIYDAIEIGLTRDELRQALRSWLNWKASISDYRVTVVSLHPNSKYLVRFTVEPPLEKTDQEQLMKSDDLQKTLAKR